MSHNKQKVFVGFLFGAAFAVIGLATWFPSKSQPCSPSPNGSASRSPDLQSKPDREFQSKPQSNSSGPSEDSTSGKFLIYTCGKGDTFCGGWGDRQKGLTTTFLLAIVTNRRFGIRMTTPCNVTQFYLPNRYNWIIHDEDLAGKTRRSVRCIDTCSFDKDLFMMDFNSRYPEDVIFLTTNNDYYKTLTSNPRYAGRLPVWARGRPVSRFFHDAWQILMKPSSLLRQRLDSFLRSLHFVNRTQPLVGLHVRVGRSASMTDTEVLLNVDKIGYVWDFVAGYVLNGSHLFLATDNAAVRQTSRRKFGPAHHDTNSVLMHIDQQRNSGGACQAFEDALLEQLILTHCDVRVVPRKSGFSRRAAMIHGSVENVFEFHGNRIVPLDVQTLSAEWHSN